MTTDEMIDLWLFVGSLAGALQGCCGIALVTLARRRRSPPRWARALTWSAFACACLIAYGVWQDGVEEIIVLLRLGGRSVLIALVIFVPTFAITGALVPLWLLVAAFQHGSGRAYQAALWVTLPLVAPLASLAVLVLAGGVVIVCWIVVFWLLNVIGNVMGR